MIKMDCININKILKDIGAESIQKVIRHCLNDHKELEGFDHTVYDYPVIVEAEKLPDNHPDKKHAMYTVELWYGDRKPDRGEGDYSIPTHAIYGITKDGEPIIFCD